jgi:hypothetical protein
MTGAATRSHSMKLSESGFEYDRQAKLPLIPFTMNNTFTDPQLFARGDLAFCRRTDSLCEIAPDAKNCTTVNRTFRISRILVGVCASLLGILLVVSVMTFLGIPSWFGPHVHWLFSSQQYKRAVLSSPRVPNQLAHAEWDGDGWGGAPVGDWMGYVVYDPSDSLPQIGTREPSRKIKGVPCDVVAVRRLERGGIP